MKSKICLIGLLCLTLTGCSNKIEDQTVIESIELPNTHIEQYTKEEYVIKERIEELIEINKDLLKQKIDLMKDIIRLEQKLADLTADEELLSLEEEN